MTAEEPLLELEDLEKHFYQNRSLVDSLLFRTGETIRAVDGVSMTLRPNEVKGIIGESGCGKSTLIKTLIGVEQNTGGWMRYRGEKISDFSKTEMKEFRRNTQIILQDPYNSLDPKMKVRDILQEQLTIHGLRNEQDRIEQVLADVELRPPDRYVDRYPEQLSGGEKQRVSIARALILEPDILLADEPVSMLDVSTQASILSLLSDLIDEYDVSMFYISHDLSTVAHVCDTINVMYLGRIVEAAPTMDLLEDPKHPYSKALTAAIPIPDPDYDREKTDLPGSPPNPVDLGEGCRFADRCPDRMDVCTETPETVAVDADRTVACHLYDDHWEDEEGRGGESRSGGHRQEVSE